MTEPERGLSNEMRRNIAPDGETRSVRSVRSLRSAGVVLGLALGLGLLGSALDCPAAANPVDEPSAAPPSSVPEAQAPKTAQDTKPDAAEEGPPPKWEFPTDMRRYQFVMLKADPKKAEPEASIMAKMQKEHLDGLAELMKQRKAVAVGPVENGGKLRGIVVLAVETIEEAEALLENDPFLRAKLLVPEIHEWFADKTVFKEPPKFLDVEPYFLGLLRRPKNAPKISDEEKAKIQQGHMANIHKMAASGDLVVAGPFGGNSDLRGVFVFRGTSPDRIRQLVSHDPAVEARRLEMELFTWYLPKGVLPASPSPAAPSDSK